MLEYIERIEFIFDNSVKELTARDISNLKEILIVFKDGVEVIVDDREILESDEVAVLIEEILGEDGILYLVGDFDEDDIEEMDMDIDPELDSEENSEGEFGLGGDWWKND